MKQKTAIQELVDIMNKDQVSFIEWFQDNYDTYLEKEKEQIIEAFTEGYLDDGHTDFNPRKYYNKTYKQD